MVAVVLQWLEVRKASDGPTGACVFISQQDPVAGAREKEAHCLGQCVCAGLESTHRAPQR